MWYYTIGDEELGPVPASELKAMASDGTVKPNALVWKEGMTDWAEARTIRGLVPAQQPARSGRDEYDDSEYDDDGHSNPYAAPQESGRASQRRRMRNDGPEYDSFTQGFIITDLVFCILRAMSVPFTILAVVLAGGILGWLELISAVVIAAAGITAAIMLLKKKEMGITFGWLTVGGTVLSLVGAIAGLFAQDNVPPDVAMFAIVIGVFLFLIRVALLGCYCVALKRAKEVLG